jgi:hypothetical protein
LPNLELYYTCNRCYDKWGKYWPYIFIFEFEYCHYDIDEEKTYYKVLFSKKSYDDRESDSSSDTLTEISNCKSRNLSNTITIPKNRTKDVLAELTKETSKCELCDKMAVCHLSHLQSNDNSEDNYEKILL